MTITWDAPAHQIITTAAPGLPRLLATLEAAAAAVRATVLLPPSSAIDPFNGYAAARSVLVNLLVGLDLDPPPSLGDLDPAPSPAAAAVVVDQLYRDAADLMLDLALALRDQLPGTGADLAQVTCCGVPAHQLLAALPPAMADLSEAHLATFGRPW